MDLKADLADQSVSFAAWTTETGAPVTITSATAGLSLWYRRGVAGAKTAITPIGDLATLETAHTDKAILVIEGAMHRLDLPDAATVAGVLTVEWGGTATGITIDGGVANLIGQANTATDQSHIAGTAANAPLTAAQTRSAVGLATANLDTQLAAILEDTGTTLPATLTAISGYVDCLPATWVVPSAAGDAMALTASERNSVADAVLKRGVSNTQGTADADSLTTIILGNFHSSVNGTVWTIYRTDDTTVFDTKALATTATATYITGVS